MKFFYIVICSILFTSCSVTEKYSNSKDFAKIDTCTINDINGAYNGELWAYLDPLWRKTKIKQSSAYVTLFAKSKKRIIANFMQNDTIIDSRVLKGKIKNGYFSVRRKIFPIGIPFVFFWFYTKKTDIALTTKNDLFLVVGISEMLDILVVPMPSKESFQKTFRKYK